MVANIETHIAYRCPECGQTIYAFVGKFALSANLLRIKCSCGNSALDINITNDKKIRLSVPCIFCRKSHSFVVSESIFFGRDKFLLNCPYANMDICFIGSKELIDAEIERLKKSEAVKLAQKEQRLMYRKRKYLADLRWLEKRGKALMAEGWTADTLELLFRDIPEVEA